MYSPFIFNTLNSKDVNDHVHSIALKKHVEQRAQYLTICSLPIRGICQGVQSWASCQLVWFISSYIVQIKEKQNSEKLFVLRIIKFHVPRMEFALKTFLLYYITLILYLPIGENPSCFPSTH